MKRIITILLLVIGSYSYAEEEITGAFGFLLGKTYKTQYQAGTFFPIKKAKKQFRKFQNYYISVNKEQKISAICAEYEAKSTQEANEEIEIIEKILENKYGEKPQQISTEKKEIQTKRIIKGGTIIELQKIGKQIRVIYWKQEPDQQPADIEKEISQSKIDAL